MYQSLSFFVAGLALVHGLAVPEPEMLDLSERTNGPITVAANPKTAGATACSNLAKVFKDETFMPGTANYTIEASDSTYGPFP